MGYRRRGRSGRQSLGEAARLLLERLGMDDFAEQAKCRRIFDELYAQRFSGHVTFLGVRAGVVYLRVRDGSWVRRAQAFESRILHDLKTLCELKTEPQRIKVMVGESSSES